MGSEHADHKGKAGGTGSRLKLPTNYKEDVSKEQNAIVCEMANRVDQMFSISKKRTVRTRTDCTARLS